MADVFEKRIRRAEQLAKEWPFAAELLRFYGKVFAIQARIYNDSNAVPDPETTPLVPLLRMFLDLVIHEGPPELAERARGLHSTLGTLLAKFSAGEALDDPVLEFFPRALHQPLLRSTQLRTGATPKEGEAQDHCPMCGSLPLLSVLREDKNAATVRRSLICSRCSHEWDYARVLCPSCKEERTEKLPRYTAQEIPWMRVEGCDSCGKYLKSVDLTLNWDAEPVVDELASTPLDVIAHEHGYTKIAPNLAGI